MIQTHKMLRVWMLFNAKKVHDYDEKQTVINSHQERKRQ